MENNFRSNFGIMIPQGQFRLPPIKKISWKKKLLCRLIGHRWEPYMITCWGPLPHQCKRCKKITSVQWPFRLKKWLLNLSDILLHPLCYVHAHRWIATYGFRSFTFGGGESSQETEEQHYVCGRCKKKKTIKVK